MRRFAWIGLVAMVGLTGVACNDALEGKEAFIATLSGAEEVPARGTAANGSAQILVEGNQISYAIEIDDITAITASHIHIGPASATGPVRLFLYPAPPNTAAPLVTVTDKRILVQATVDSSAVIGVSFDQLLDAMRTGNAYVNVHTTQFPAGEMRGIVRPQSLN